MTTATIDSIRAARSAFQSKNAGADAVQFVMSPSAAGQLALEIKALAECGQAPAGAIVTAQDVGLPRVTAFDGLPVVVVPTATKPVAAQ